MHSKIALVSLLATLALANPIDRRALTTEIETVTVWTTVTGDVQPTAAPERNQSPDAPEAAPIPVPVAETPDTEPGNFVYEGDSDKAPEPTAAPAPEPAPAPEAAPEAAPEPAPAPAPAPETPAPAAEEPAPEQQAPAPAPAPAPSTGNLDGYAAKALKHHNIHRSNHTNTQPISWSDDLAATALKIAKSCVYEHDTATDKDKFGVGYGQNIGAGYSAEAIDEMLTNAMYNDEMGFYESSYGSSDPVGSGKTGHFTQMVWKGTKQVGCATYTCDVLAKTNNPDIPPVFTVCNYAPPGNYQGEYGNNVGKPLGQAMVSV